MKTAYSVFIHMYACITEGFISVFFWFFMQVHILHCHSLPRTSFHFDCDMGDANA
jgi:hypothetical protein